MYNLAIANNSTNSSGTFGAPEELFPFWDVIVEKIISILQVFSKALSLDSLRKLTDDQCVRKLSSGDEAPFQVLFERYGDLVFGYCVKLLKDRERAEDASQDVWMKVIRNADKFKSQGKFRAWLLQIARNTCFSLFRDLKKNSSESIADHELQDVSQGHILELMTTQEDKSQLRQCMDQLPDNQRLVLLIWMTEDKSYDEIAKQMDTTVSSVKSLLFRGREKLKDLMGGAHG